MAVWLPDRCEGNKGRVGSLSAQDRRGVHRVFKVTTPKACTVVFLFVLTRAGLNHLASLSSHGPLGSQVVQVPETGFIMTFIACSHSTGSRPERFLSSVLKHCF